VIEPGEVPFKVKLRHRVAGIDFAFCQHPDRIDVIAAIVFINDLPQDHVSETGGIRDRPRFLLVISYVPSFYRCAEVVTFADVL
jgi:hypothetical protein